MFSGIICLGGRLLHRYFVYMPDSRRIAPKDAGLASVDEIVFKAADGTRLIAWYREAQPGKPTLLYFTGNSGNTADRASKIKAIGADGYGYDAANAVEQVKALAKPDPVERLGQSLRRVENTR